MGSCELGADGAGGLGGGTAVSGPPGGGELNRACPAVGDVARLRALWAAAAEQRLPPANAAHAVWGDRLAAASRTVSEGLPRRASCAVGSGVGIGAPPTHGGGSAVDGLSVGGICAVRDGPPITAAVGRGRAGGGHALEVGAAGGAAGDGAARGRVRSVDDGETPRGRAISCGTGSAAAGARRGWGDGTVSTAPPHGEGEDPVARDQGGDSGPPGRAAEPKGERA